MTRVLCTGVQPALLQSRKLLLERAGHEVVTATSEDDVRQACAKKRFHVAVIGQVVNRHEKERILRLLRELCPGAKVLELFQPHSGKILPDADDWLEVPTAVPSDLAERVTALCKRRR